MRKVLILLIVTAVMWLIATSATVASVGRWHVPGTLAQYFGYGFGPGHHAPIIRYPGYRTASPPRIVIAPPECRPGGYGCYTPSRPTHCYRCAAQVPNQPTMMRGQGAVDFRAHYIPAGLHLR